MSVYEGTKGMLQKFQNNIFERVNQLLKVRDEKIDKNTSDIIYNAKQASQDLEKLKKMSEEEIKKLLENVIALTENTNELKTKLQDAITRIEVLEGKTKS